MPTTTTTLRETLELIEKTELQSLVSVDIGYQPMLEREVVIKRLKGSAAADPRLRGRFVKEMRALAALNHHGIVRVYDAGEEDGVPYVVLEKLTGITVQQRLDQLVDRRVRMDLEEAVKIVGDVADIVAYANQHHVQLYDLTPTNIVLTNDQRTVLADPGQPLPEKLLNASTLILTYAAPERIMGGNMDQRSDVYALGVLLAHLVFGQPPFEGSSIGIVTQKQNSASLPVLDNLYPDLPCPPILAHVMRQATAQQPNHRYASVAAFRKALTDALTVYPNQTQLLPGRTNQAPPTAPITTTRNIPSTGWNSMPPAAAAGSAPGTWAYVQPEQHPHGGMVETRSGQYPPHDQSGAKESVAYVEPQIRTLQPVTENAPSPVERVARRTVEEVRPAFTAQPLPAYEPPIVEEVTDQIYDEQQPRPAEIRVEQQSHGTEIYIDQPALSTPTPDITVIEWETLDPLMPGRDDPSLHAALPYTILVPMPTPQEASNAAASSHHAAHSNQSTGGGRNYIHLIAMIILGILAVSAAMMFG